jgi:hypothetical protein
VELKNGSLYSVLACSGRPGHGKFHMLLLGRTTDTVRRGLPGLVCCSWQWESSWQTSSPHGHSEVLGMEVRMVEGSWVG